MTSILFFNIYLVSSGPSNTHPYQSVPRIPQLLTGPGSEQIPLGRLQVALQHQHQSHKQHHPDHQQHQHQHQQHQHQKSPIQNHIKAQTQQHQTSPLQNHINAQTQQIKEIRNSLRQGGQNIRNGLKQGSLKIKDSLQQGRSKIRNSLKQGGSKIRNSLKQGGSKITSSLRHGKLKIRNGLNRGRIKIRDCLNHGSFRHKSQPVVESPSKCFFNSTHHFCLSQEPSAAELGYARQFGSIFLQVPLSKLPNDPENWSRLSANNLVEPRVDSQSVLFDPDWAAPAPSSSPFSIGCQ